MQSTEVTRRVVEKLKDQLTGGRRVIVIAADATGYTVLLDDRDHSAPYAADKIALRLSQLWASHDPAGWVVVLKIGTPASPYISVGLAPLPWRDPAGSWCPQCGAEAAGAPAHACARATPAPDGT